MRISPSLLALIFFLVIFSACEENDLQPVDTPKAIDLTPKAGEIISSSNNFGIELFALVAKEEEKNFMLSPLSASIALTMALNGADGETYNQIRDMLGYPVGMSREEIHATYKSLANQFINADNKVKLAIANALFYRLDFKVKEPFINTLRNDFNTQVEGLDFNLPSALTTINKWASDNTNKRILKVLDEIGRDEVMFLMNALYFKGDWTHQFDKSKTADYPFNLDNGSSISVETMQGKVGAKVGSSSNFTFIEMPYGRKNFSMVIIVPTNTLSDFYENLTPSTWHTITAQLEGNNQWGETMVKMPKFTFDYEKKLNDALIDLGMTEAFDSGKADFSQISNQDIFISFVKQNTFVDVNEVGTEAAAVTTIAFVRTSLDPTFIVDKPFVFVIRERTTNTMLFIGSVNNPE